jgi:hypothetical protein
MGVTSEGAESSMRRKAILAIQARGARPPLQSLLKGYSKSCWTPRLRLSLWSEQSVTLQRCFNLKILKQESDCMPTLTVVIPPTTIAVQITPTILTCTGTPAYLLRAREQPILSYRTATRASGNGGCVNLASTPLEIIQSQQCCLATINQCVVCHPSVSIDRRDYRLQMAPQRGRP